MSALCHQYVTNRTTTNVSLPMHRIQHQFQSLWRRRQSTHLALFCMLLPYLIGLTALILLPSLLTFALAFTQYDALTPPIWIGLTHFVRFAGDRLFWLALSNSLLYLALAVPLRLGSAFLLALLFKGQHRGVNLARAAVFLPTVIPDIAYATIWLVSFNPQYGPVNLLLAALHLPTPAWTSTAWPAFWALVIMATWQMGESFVVLLASARNLPEPLYEAAAIDGAGSWQRYRYLTLPMLLPSLVLLTARDLIVSLQANFVPSLVVTKGGPGYATLFIPLYTYWLAFDDLRFGYAAAVLWTLYALTLTIVIGQYWVTRRWQYEGAYA